MLSSIFRYSFKNGTPKKIINTPLFNLKYEKNNLSKPQIAIVASKKIDNRATVRNKVKRIFSEELRKILNKSLSYDLVFYLKKDVLNKDNSYLEKEISKVLKNLS